jgi:hypothetical protein
MAEGTAERDVESDCEGTVEEKAAVTNVSKKYIPRTWVREVDEMTARAPEMLESVVKPGREDGRADGRTRTMGRGPR